jgi:hypothetical protein
LGTLNSSESLTGRYVAEFECSLSRKSHVPSASTTPNSRMHGQRSASSTFFGPHRGFSMELATSKGPRIGGTRLFARCHRYFISGLSTGVNRRRVPVGRDPLQSELITTISTRFILHKPLATCNGTRAFLVKHTVASTMGGI